MDAQHTLVRIYLFVCRHYRGRLAATVQRQSNNDEPDFTDEEVLTIYLFGLFKKRETVSDIHEYAEDHFLGWFPNLPSYQSYNRRPDRLNPIFSPLLEKALQEIDCKKPRGTMLRIADSMPIMMASGQRASQAKVASERIVDVGYCSSKDTFYHGAGAPRCRRTEKRQTSASGQGWPDIWERKRPSGSSSRSAGNRRRSSLRRQGLLSRKRRARRRFQPPISSIRGP